MENNETRLVRIKREEKKHGIAFGLLIAGLLLLNLIIIFLSWKAHKDGQAPLAALFQEIEKTIRSLIGKSSSFYHSTETQNFMDRVKGAYRDVDFDSIKNTMRELYSSAKESFFLMNPINRNS